MLTLGATTLFQPTNLVKNNHLLKFKLTLNADNFKILGESISLNRLFPPVTEGSQLLVAARPDDYLATRVARAVEDTDAHLLNLNVLADRTPHDELMIHLRVDRRDAFSVARSLERYGYRVIESQSAAESDDDTGGDNDAESATRDRINHLLRLLEI